MRPGDKVAINLTNRPEYLETFYAALKLGAVPVNVNYRYGAEEIRYLLDDSDAKVVVTEAGVRARTCARRSSASRRRLGQEVRARRARDRRRVRGRARATPTDRRTGAARVPSGDDLIFLYTGGTTGMPKGVMWRNDDLYVALWQMGRPGTEPPDPAAAVLAGKRAATALPACPLMHGTGLFITLSTLAGGGTVVLIDKVGLDAALIWSEVERNAVQILTIVGDVFARPLLAALDAEPDRWDLSSLRAITSSGVTWSPEVKRALLEPPPERHDARLARRVRGAHEPLGGEGRRRADRARPGSRSTTGSRSSPPEGREVGRGTDEVGMVAVGGRIPLGYYKDPEKTARDLQGRRRRAATPSPVTTRRWTPTAPSGSSGAAPRR